MTTEEREMLLEMPAVLELLGEEREACAALAEAWLPDYAASRHQFVVDGQTIAAAIRARKDGAA